MAERPDRIAEARGWVVKAEHDLLNARYVLTMPDNCPTDTVCFHAQQCAEKYLKALLTAGAIGYPRTHDLVVLLNLALPASGLKLSVESLQPLNRYAVETRYPGDWEPIDRAEAQEAVKMAERVRAAVRRALPPDAAPS
jgi:HEPN domain-containing protein